MDPNTAVNAATVALQSEPAPPEQWIAGEPRTAAVVLDDFAGLQIGVWEMTPGVLRDTESDEIFVVLAGTATVEFADGTPTLTVKTGDVVRLGAGAQTVWTVTETLRKVYLQ